MAMTCKKQERSNDYGKTVETGSFVVAGCCCYVDGGAPAITAAEKPVAVEKVQEAVFFRLWRCQELRVGGPEEIMEFSAYCGVADPVTFQEDLDKATTCMENS